MELISRLTQDMKAALKAGDKQRLSVIRMLLSDAKTADLKKITPEEAVAAYGKRLAKSAEEYEKYGKSAEVDQLKKEIAVVRQYLPKKTSVEETAALVDQFLAGHSFTERQIGQAMGAFMKAHGQQVEAATANGLIRQKLAGRN